MSINYIPNLNKNYKTEKMRSPRVEEVKNNDLKIKTKDLKSAKSSKQMQTSPKSNLNKSGINPDNRSKVVPFNRNKKLEKGA